MLKVAWIVLWLGWLAAVEGTTPRVCIVGSGIGGGAVAAFLREADPDVKLEVFEKRSEVGGRTRTLKFDRVEFPIDAGAAIVHRKNRYIMQFAENLTLDIKTTLESNWGIFDGKAFLFESTGVEAVDAGKLWWRYGNDLMKMQKIVNDFMEKFSRVYELQAAGVAYQSPVEALQQLEIYDLTQTSLRAYMESKRISSKLIDELMTAVNRVNYGQDCSLNALAGMVGLAGAGSDLRVVKNGFQQLSKGLLNQSGAEVHLGHEIEAIERDGDGFVLKSKGRKGAAAKCNAVVIAAPLEQSSLQLPSSSISLHRREFQLTQTTFVRGTLKASAFGKKSSPPSAVYTVEAPDLQFSSIGCYTPQNQTDAVYKVFSRAELSEEFLRSVFEGAEVLEVIPWPAYPRFSPPEKFSPFVLEKGLVYLNTMESAASAMEVSAIAAKNAALLVQQWLEIGTTPPRDNTQAHVEL